MFIWLELKIRSVYLVSSEAQKHRSEAGLSLVSTEAKQCFIWLVLKLSRAESGLYRS